MKVIVNSVIAVIVSVGLTIQCEAALIITWNTTGNLGTETSEPSVTNDAGLAASNLTLGSVTPGANGNRFGGSGWFNTGNTAGGNTLSEAVAGNDYIEFIVSPNAGFQFTATSFDFIWDRSGTGPSAVTLRSSIDSFTSDLGSVSSMVSGGVATSTLRTISISGVSGISTSTTFRLYGYGATATGGTGGFDTSTIAPNVILNGTVSAVPEPTGILMVGAAIGLVGFGRRRGVKIG